MFLITNMILLIGLLVGFNQAFANENFSIGVAKNGIKFPIRGNRLMGYSNPSQVSGGKLDELYSRAFLIQQNQEMFAFVVIDTLSVSENIRLKILQQVPWIEESNLMIMATHTHSAPGGYDPFDIYNYAAFGFDEKVEKVILDSIKLSLNSARENLKAGSISIIQDELTGISYNRSVKAYNNNIDKDKYSKNVDSVMTILKFYQNDRLAGILNWYPVHATSIRNSNKMLSGDNKGIAAWLVENELDIVAAFANSNAGDVSPNIKKIRKKKDYTRVRYIGFKQAEKTLEMLDSDGEETITSMQSFYSVQKFPQYEIRAEFTFSGNKEFVCEPAVGISTLCGTEDGKGLPAKLGVSEGMSHSNKKFSPAAWITALFLPLELRTYRKKMNRPIETMAPVKPKDLFKRDKCQGEKIVIGWLKTDKGYGVSSYLPFQAFRMNNYIITAVPGEYSTMAGRRMKSAVKNVLELEDTEQVIIAGYANSFTSYITTYEEYEKQHYEGASTLYGPNTAAAQRQIVVDMLLTDRRGKVTLAGKNVYEPPFHLKVPEKRRRESKEDFYDSSNIELTKKQPKPSYSTDEVIKAEFHTSDPRFDLSSLEVLQMIDANENIVLDSKDPRLQVRFKYSKKKMKEVQIRVRLDSSIPSGEYSLKFNMGKSILSEPFLIY